MIKSIIAPSTQSQGGRKAFALTFLASWDLGLGCTGRHPKRARFAVGWRFDPSPPPGPRPLGGVEERPLDPLRDGFYQG